MSNFSHIVIRAGVWATLLRVVTRLFNFLQLAILTRLLSPTDFGVFGLALLIYGLLDALSDLGLDDSLIRTRNPGKDYLDTFFIVNILRASIIFILILLIANPIALFFGEPQSSPLIMAIGFLSILGSLHNPAVIYFQKDLDLRSEFIYRTTGTVIGFCISVGIALIQPSPWVLLYGMATEKLVQLFVSYQIIVYRPGINFSRGAFYEMFGFGKWLMMSQVFKYLAINTPLWVLTYLLGASALGIYQIAARLSQTIGTEICKVVAIVGFPTFSKINLQPSLMKFSYVKSQCIIMPVAGLLFSFLIAIPEQIVIAIIGQKWIDAAPLIRIMGIIGLLQSMGAQIEVIKSFGHTKYIAIVAAMRLVLTLVTIYPFIYWFGLEGAALSTLLPIVILFVFTQGKVFALINLAIPYFIATILPVIISFFITTLLLLVVDSVYYTEKSILGFFSLVFFGGLLYVCLLLCIDYITGKRIISAYRELFKKLYFFSNYKNN